VRFLMRLPEHVAIDGTNRGSALINAPLISTSDICTRCSRPPNYFLPSLSIHALWLKDCHHSVDSIRQKNARLRRSLISRENESSGGKYFPLQSRDRWSYRRRCTMISSRATRESLQRENMKGRTMSVQSQRTRDASGRISRIYPTPYHI